jgi:tetraacyldisaccharide 4'-kinase
MRFLLFPISWIYGIIVWFRNMLFDAGILSSKSFDMPIISIGNITVGGTGKTPHTEYLVRLLSQNYKVAVLSRGYKRKKKGFILANTLSQVAEVGDEPLQMKRKFPELIVAVDKNRREGIQNLMDEKTNKFIDIILLDDAFQHRFVNSSINILLIDYNRMLYNDFLLPTGNLRETASQVKRADIVIISKCPQILKPIEIRLLSKKLNLYPYQSLYLTTMQYGGLKALSPLAGGLNKQSAQCDLNLRVDDKFRDELTMSQIKDKKIPVLILAGVASPQSLIDYVRNYCPDVQSLLFSDHHEFNKKDAHKISFSFEKIKNAGGIIISTEKDVMRILDNPFMEAFVNYIYYLDLQVHFLEERGLSFDQKILDYVGINRRDHKLA